MDETLQECISRAEEYHFVRVLTREGPVLLQMLEKDKFIWQDAEYKNQVLTECRQMAEAYPSYLSEEGEEADRFKYQCSQNTEITGRRHGDSG